MVNDKPWLEPVPLTNVWLMREGDYAVLYVERDGNYYEAIREHLDSNFSHNISAEGIRHLSDDRIPAWSRQAEVREVDAPPLKPCEHCGAIIGHYDGCPTVPPGLRARSVAPRITVEDGVLPHAIPAPAVEVGHGRETGETPPDGYQARHISLGQSHKVSVTGMTRCKVCNSKIIPGQTFYFFGTDGPYCAACYADDPRKKTS